MFFLFSRAFIGLEIGSMVLKRHFSSVLRRECKVSGFRGYARIVGGMINSPPPPAPAQQGPFKVIVVSQKRAEDTSDGQDKLSSSHDESLKLSPVLEKASPFSLDISHPRTGGRNEGFRTVLEPPKPRADQDLYNHLIKVVNGDKLIQDSPSLRRIVEDLNTKANVETPYVLRNGNAGSPDLPLDRIARSVVTIAHILPPLPGSTNQGEVILSSGFAILDGSLVATCTHPIHQINALCRSPNAAQQEANLDRVRTVAIAFDGMIVPIQSMESHLVMSDIVLLRIPETTKLTPLKVSPYPCPTGSPVLVYSLHDVALSSDPGQPVQPITKWSWTPSEITLYQDRAGRESATGSYKELNTLLFDTVPRPGSSGGPIIDRETKAVVGITRGSEVSYAVRKERGFATPAESLFNVFKLDGF